MANRPNLKEKDEVGPVVATCLVLAVASGLIAWIGTLHISHTGTSHIWPIHSRLFCP